MGIGGVVISSGILLNDEPQAKMGDDETISSTEVSPTSRLNSVSHTQTPIPSRTIEPKGSPTRTQSKPPNTPMPARTSTRVNIPTPTSTKEKTSAPTFTLTPTFDWGACHAVYVSRLKVGDNAYVSYEPPLANNVRQEPYKGSTLLGKIRPGDEVTIIEGPSCSNGWVWWKITAKKDGLTGWTVEGDANEYWLIPIK